MAAERRRKKINELLREVIAGILARGMQFPDGALVTVTRAEVSDNMFYADVFVSVFGAAEKQEKEVLDALARSVGEIQRMVNRKLRTRPVPRITFAIDQAEKRRERVERLLSEQK